MNVSSTVVVTLAKVILKFGYDQINISYRNVLIEKHVKSQQVRRPLKHSRLNYLVFIINAEISS